MTDCIPSGFPKGRPLPLSSKRIYTSILSLIASALELPASGPTSKEELLAMVEGNLSSSDHEPQNVQVIVDEDDYCRTGIQLIGGRGPIVDRIVLEDQIVIDDHVSAREHREGSFGHGDLKVNEGNQDADSEDLAKILKTVREEKESLLREVEHMKSELAVATEKMQIMWTTNCSIVWEFDDILVNKLDNFWVLLRITKGSFISLQQLPSHFKL